MWENGKDFIFLCISTISIQSAEGWPFLWNTVLSLSCLLCLLFPDLLCLLYVHKPDMMQTEEPHWSLWFCTPCKHWEHLTHLYSVMLDIGYWAALNTNEMQLNLAFTVDKMIMRSTSIIINIEALVLSSDLHSFYNCSTCSRAKLVA